MALPVTAALLDGAPHSNEQTASARAQDRFTGRGLLNLPRRPRAASSVLFMYRSLWICGSALTRTDWLTTPLTTRSNVHPIAVEGTRTRILGLVGSVAVERRVRTRSCKKPRSLAWGLRALWIALTSLSSWTKT